MLTDTQCRTMAAQMRAAQDEARQIEPFTSHMPTLDLPAAYAVADLMHKSRLAEGCVPVGRKIGFTNSAMWSIYGVREPVWGWVYNTSVSAVSEFAVGRGRCSLGRFVEPKIEPEIVFHFHSAPPAGAGLEELLQSIDWVASAFEIVQSHFPGWRFQAADTVVDSTLHAALLIGEPLLIEKLAPDPQGTLRSFTLALSRDGVVVETGCGANVLGSPLIALAHLAEVLSKQQGALPLQAGEIVTTGTLTPARPVSDGERWQTTLQGIALPGLAVEFVR